MSDLVESIFSDMPTVGYKKRTFKRVPDQSVLWVVSYPRKLWTPVSVSFHTPENYGPLLGCIL